MTPAELAASLSRLLQEETDPKPAGAAAPKAGKAAKGEPFLDMMLLATRAGWIRRGCAAFLRRRSRRRRKKSAPAQAPMIRFRRHLKPRKKHPDDLGIAICETLRAIGFHDAARQEAAVARLVRLVEQTPLESLEEGVAANSRQRALAARQIPLWLVGAGLL